jgi:signal transduction histidine kinase
MGTHGAAGTRARALPRGRNADASTAINPVRRRPLNLSDWPVARRLFAVIVAALLMGVIFGGLRVADAESSAAQYSRVSQLANLGQKLTILVNDLQNERDETLSLLTAPEPGGLTTMQPFFAQTKAGVAAVEQASDIGGLPANIENDITTVTDDISPSRIQVLQSTLGQPQDVFSVIGNYAAEINDMIALADQVDQGVSDSTLASEVQAYNAMALAKEQASEQRALLNDAFASPTQVTVTYGPPPSFAIVNPKQSTSVTVDTLDSNSEAALSDAYGQEFIDEHAFYQAATPAEALNFTNQVGSEAVGIALGLEQNMFANVNSDYFIDNGITDTTQNVSGSQLVPNVQTLVYPPGPPPSASPTNPGASSGVLGYQLPTSRSIRKLSPNNQVLAQGQAAWDAGADDELTAMQNTETLIAGNIATRASQLQQAAQQTALTYGIITVVVLLIVLLAALVVARSLVLPLRRLRAGALNIASVQLPERVRLLTESPDAATSMEVAPINVPYKDEIGEVARAFDQVHSEAVRLAGEQALLRSTFNAMFVNLSRRSQSLIERLARMIDNLEQNEADPDRLGSLFSMDHLVTRMRRNSENLLLLAGHENPRKRSESVPLADVARAAISEIEQYNRIALNIAPAIAVIGVAVSDVAHLLAELIENATIYSPKDTQVQVVMQEVASGGVLIEIRDKGIGVSDARLADMNWRLDNPPTIDVSVSRHMGLFAVARLAERHQVRVRLRPATPQGLSALVWLPESVVERTGIYGMVSGWQSQVIGTRSGAQPTGGRPFGEMPDGVVAAAPNIGAIEHGSYPEGPRTAKGWFRGREGGSEGLGGAQDWSAPPSRSFDNRASAGLPARSGPASDLTSAGLPARASLTNLNSDSGPDTQAGLPDWADSARGGPVPSIGSSPGDGSAVLGRSFDHTSTGLPVRTPRANLNSDAGSDSKAGLPQRADSALGGPTPGNGTRTGGQPLPQRSADQVRSRLAGFQRGTRRAESEQGQSPRAGEGSER